MYEDAKKMLESKGYASISELVRDALRKTLYRKEELTVNGFTKEFEDEVLKAASEREEDDFVLETEEDINNYFRYLKLPSKKK